MKKKRDSGKGSENFRYGRHAFFFLDKIIILFI